MKAALLIIATAFAQSTPAASDPAQLIGTWRGTSTCTDRVAAPACQDETAVYEFTPSAKPGTVHWAADKIVTGKRVRMGESDIAYDKGESCWKVDSQPPQVHIVWRLTVDGSRLSGTARTLPGNATVRKVELSREHDRP